ncbi:Rieske 2Fe-2S domain-containing protein [Streptomyces klenkii]
MSRMSRYALGESAGPAPTDSLFPPVLPNPDGWFCVAFADELKPGTVLTRRLMGEDVVLYRTHSGRLRAVRAYCPHLGAHLGAGGTVEGECLVCPFHRFAYDPAGNCVRTGYGLRPPKAALTRYPVCEANGSVHVWRHSRNAPPDWEVPTHFPAAGVPTRHRTFDIAGHPQDVIENIFDDGHMTQLHGLSDLHITGGPPVPGQKAHTLHVRTRRPAPLLNKLLLSYRVTVIGLGTILSDAPLPGLNTAMRMSVHATPTAPGRLQLRIGTVLELRPLPLLPRPLAQLLANIASRPLTRLAQWWICRNVAEDFLIWHHQRHQVRPRLAEGDGPIGSFRQWARQFYTAPTPSDASAIRGAAPGAHGAPLSRPPDPAHPRGGEDS